MDLVDWLSQQYFRIVHGCNLVYAACWEDPRVDREAMQLGSEDTVLVITSAGCNVLDYALDSPRWIYAVDVNYRQNALLELKLAGIRNLDFATFFEIFGHGYLADIKEVYRTKLRQSLSNRARQYWDRHISLFQDRSRSFYFHSTSGTFAWLLNLYIDGVARLRPAVNKWLDARDLRTQRTIYFKELRDRFWTPAVQWALGSSATLVLSGVPRAQVRHARRFESDIPGHLRRCAEYCISHLPLSDNYFWRLYLTGRYTPECCPEYLKQANFDRLKSGLVDRISIHTDTVSGFLANHEVKISRFILLDHLDWFYGKHFKELEAEWQGIVNRASPNARLVWRSMGRNTDFINGISVRHLGRRRQVGELLHYHNELSAQLILVERVKSYSSLLIADLRG